jgi:hypothetical protein
MFLEDEVEQQLEMSHEVMMGRRVDMGAIRAEALQDGLKRRMDQLKDNLLQKLGHLKTADLDHMQAKMHAQLPKILDEICAERRSNFISQQILAKMRSLITTLMEFAMWATAGTSDLIDQNYFQQPVESLGVLVKDEFLKKLIELHSSLGKLLEGGQNFPPGRSRESPKKKNGKSSIDELEKLAGNNLGPKWDSPTTSRRESRGRNRGYAGHVRTTIM